MLCTATAHFNYCVEFSVDSEKMPSVLPTSTPTLFIQIDYNFWESSPKSVGLPYFCGAPLFLWRSPKSAEALFYQWLPQMRAAPPNLFLKKAHRKWPFLHPKHEQNGSEKKL